MVWRVCVNERYAGEVKANAASVPTVSNLEDRDGRLFSGMDNMKDKIASFPQCCVGIGCGCRRSGV
jgi:hypothetical protein